MAIIDEAELKGLTYYAVDRASPFELARSAQTKTLESILKYTLVQLQIVAPTGMRDLWLIINAHAWKYGGGEIAPDTAMKCKTVLEVWNAVRASANLPAVTK